MATKTKEVLNLAPNVRELLQAVIYGYGFEAPTDGVTGAGDALPGSLYVDQTNKVLYRNTGTQASPVWNSVAGVSADEITLARGSILRGNSSGVAAAHNAKTSGQILVGDGTDVVSVAVSGDVTLASNGAVTIGAGKVTNAMHVAASEDGTVVKVVANANVIGGIPVVHRITVADGTGDTDVTLTHKTRVIDVKVVKTSSAGGASDAVTVKNGANAITDAISLNDADKTVSYPTTYDDAYWDIAAAGTLRVSAVKDTNCACEVIVTGIRVA